MHKPIDMFREWLDNAIQSEPDNPNAMALASVDSDGFPDVRMVLLKNFDERGFVFFTDFKSAKGSQILDSKKAALCFYWKTLGRQIRIRGTIETVSEDESDSYFSSRPRNSQIAAWASRQSQPLEHEGDLEKSVTYYSSIFLTDAIPRPSHWSGFRLLPFSIEFWTEGSFRLHKRILFKRSEDKWIKTKLYP